MCSRAPAEIFDTTGVGGAERSSDENRRDPDAQRGTQYRPELCGSTMLSRASMGSDVAGPASSMTAASPRTDSRSPAAPLPGERASGQRGQAGWHRPPGMVVSPRFSCFQNLPQARGGRAAWVDIEFDQVGAGRRQGFPHGGMP